MIPQREFSTSISRLDVVFLWHRVGWMRAGRSGFSYHHRVSFAGLVLAGGEGRRFGGPKAFARLPDRLTFLEACCRILGEAGARPVAATLPPGFTAEWVPAMRPLPLPGPGFDMLGSLRWGLRHLISELGWAAVVMLPVDHPLVSPGSVVTLTEIDAPVVIPTFGGKHGHPILLSRAVAEGIAREEIDGATVRDVLGSMGAVDVEVDDPGITANCNTPRALRDALEFL